jgi:hypothetical protein
MLPGFTASASLYKTRNVYRGEVSSSGGGDAPPLFPALAPPWTSSETSSPLMAPPGGGGDCNCSTTCARTCKGIEPVERYNFCYQSCYDPCYGACHPTPSAANCSTTALNKCLATATSQFVTNSCHLLYGPTLPGFGCCGGMNISLNSGNHCGTCNHACPSGTTCCSRACMDTNSSISNCGSCGNVCPSGASCQGGFCVCPNGGMSCGGACCPETHSCCNGVCTDTSNDRANCGTCRSACPPGLPCCNGSCSDTSSDFSNCGGCGNLCTGSDSCFKSCCVSGAPALTSNSNYVLANGCTNILGLTATLEVTQDFVSDIGFTMQLNAVPPAGTATTWMQYVFRVSGTGIQGQVQYWDVPAFQSCSKSMPGGDCSSAETFAPLPVDIPLSKSLPIQNTLPAGYTLEVALTNDISGNVTSATFTVIDDAGASSAITIPVDASVRFPVVAFEPAIVGPDNSLAANFSSGIGVLSYAGSNGSLCVQGASSDTCSGNSVDTGETSNASYSEISPCCGSPAKQQVSVAPTSPNSCFVSNGPCAGAFGGTKCMTVNGVSQCCNSSWFYGSFPWIQSCTDGTVTSSGCGGPCF